MDLGVRPSNSYKMMIICSPSGLYYPEGLAPVKIYVEDSYVRAVRGGTGFTKTGGNYAGSIRAQVVAHEKGYSQVLWLDGVEQKYIEEVGSMNIFFKINGEVVTPALNGSILSGITRMSTIELLKSWGVPVSERRISIQEVADAYDNGTLEAVSYTNLDVYKRQRMLFGKQKCRIGRNIVCANEICYNFCCKTY